MRTPHTHCQSGKKVLVTLRDGTQYLGKFVERKRRAVVLEGKTISTEDLRAFSIYRGQPLVAGVIKLL